MSATSIPSRVAALTRDQPLRLALEVDAAVTGVNGVAYLAAAGPLEELLGLSAPLLRAVGAFLVVFAGLVALVASRPSIPALPVRAIIAANAAWTAGSLVAAAVAWSSPTTAGTVWIVLQAIVVALFAVAQGVTSAPRSRGA